MLDFDTTMWDTQLRNQLENLRQSDLERGECGKDIMGDRHKESPLLCPNTEWDPTKEDTGCKLDLIDELEQGRTDIRWVHVMMQYFWQHGLDRQALKYLRKFEFLHDYE